MTGDLDRILERARARTLDEDTPDRDFQDVNCRLEEAAGVELGDFDSEMATIVARARARTDLEIASTRRHRAATMRTPKPRRVHVGRWLVAAGIAASLAFLVVRVWNPSSAREAGAGDLARQAMDATASREALRAGARGETAKPASTADGGDGPARPRTEAVVPRIDARPIEPPVLGPEPPEESRAQEPAVVREPRHRESRAARLDRMLDDAESAWRSGDAAGAEKVLLKVVASGKSAQADLAWGDLFTLARQLRGASSEYQRWGEYLRKYPQGRHADDARAGRCRRGPPKSAVACWKAYLGDFPRGAHRGEARLALDGEDSNP